MPADNAPKLAHAVHSTGRDTTPLAGGRSRFTSNGVPILEIRQDLAAKVSEHAQKANDPNEETEYLVGTVVRLHNPSPQPGIDDSPVVVTIGGETLDEAAKSVIGVYETVFGSAAPEWIESTNKDLGEVIADHYGNCEVRSALHD
jgi:hypothetical protein